MRNIANRKLNREPVKSPSPDIANRNIIVHTHLPQAAELLNKSRTKYTDSLKSVVPIHFEDMQRSLIDTQQKYRELQRQLTVLLIENSNLKKQNNELKDLLSKNKPSFLKPSEQNQKEVTLKQYQTRFTRYSQQIKRIHQLLRREKERNEQLQSQIASFKKYDLVYPSKYNRNTHHELPYNNLRLIQQSLNQEFEKIKAEHQLKVHLSLNAINQRLAKLQRSQTSIQNAVRPEYQTPKTNKQVERYDYSTASNLFANSSQMKKFQRSGKQTQEQREIDMLRDKLRLNQLQYESAKRQNQNLVVQLQRQKEKGNLIGECQKCKFYQIKISELEKELEKIKLMQAQMRSQQERINQLLQQNAGLRNANDLYRINTAKTEEIKQQYHNETHQSELKRQQKVIFNFQDYLQRIKDVKNILNNQEFRRFLQKIHLLITQNTLLQSKLSRITEQTQKNMKENKNREIELRLLVSQLKRQNQLLKVQNKQQKQQIQQLRHIIDQQFKKPSQEHIFVETQLDQFQNVQPEAVKFKLYLNEAINRLQSMQNSLSKQIAKE